MIKLENSFTDTLPGDSDMTNVPRTVLQACYSFVKPKGMQNPTLMIYSPEVANELGLSKEDCLSEEFCLAMSGNHLLSGSNPYAMCYGGHQFGNWAGQLGDGRAINLGEYKNKAGSILNLQLKGAGPTPYSRTADGLAVLRSSIREFLCSEAMYHLGVPTTRALALVLTGENVLRDVMYDGNPAYEKGAVLCRVAPSFIRFGNFELFASRRDIDLIRRTADYVVAHYYPHLKSQANPYLEMFREVADKTCHMILQWQRVGFVHGVMNTDNMSILGLTIDYGPYGWLDDYDPNWTPNTTDLPGKRYRYANQPIVAQWNLLKLANALYPIIGDEISLKKIIEQFMNNFFHQYHHMMKQKLGLYKDEDEDVDLIFRLENLLKMRETDMTIFFRQLSLVTCFSQIADCYDVIKPSLYSDEWTEDYNNSFSSWFEIYIARLKREKVIDEVRKTKMNAYNPKYVLRNYMAQLAIEHAEKGDITLLNELFVLLKHPYEEQPQYEHWYAKRPEWAKQKIGSSKLSCSS